MLVATTTSCGYSGHNDVAQIRQALTCHKAPLLYRPRQALPRSSLPTCSLGSDGITERPSHQKFASKIWR